MEGKSQTETNIKPKAGKNIIVVLLSIFKSLKAEAWIALFSFILSIVSIYLTTQQFRKNIELNREYNVLSVRPVLNLDYHLSYNDSVIGISLINKGLGPAKIKNLEIYFDGEKLDSFYDLDSKNQSWLSKAPDITNFNEASIIPNERVYVYSVSRSKITDQQMEYAINCIKRTSLVYDYVDMYDNPDTVYLNKHLLKK